MVEYFAFEQDFVEKDIRCIPMIVRLKMDMVGIKLKLSHWNKFGTMDRVALAERQCDTPARQRDYRLFLTGLIKKQTGEDPVSLAIEQKPYWRNTVDVPLELQEKAGEFGWTISTGQWRALSELQRFALVKLCRPGHENKNFPRAMREFGWVAAY